MNLSPIELTATIAAVGLLGSALQWWTHRRHSQQRQMEQKAHLRALATLDNEHKAYIQRLQRASDKEKRSAALALATSLLPAMDALQQAIQTTQGIEGIHPDLGAGLQLVQQAFTSALQAHEITPITPQPGDAFVPQQHEAIAMFPTTDIPEGAIAAVVRTGWGHPQKLLRPAMVQIAQSPPQEADTNPQPQVPHVADLE